MLTQLLKKINAPLLILPILIFVLGELTLVSISPDRARVQLIYFLIGSLGYVFLSIFNYALLKYFWKHLYGITITLLMLTYFLGEIRSGSARWLGVGSFIFQPSELAKLAILVSLAALLTTYKSEINNIKFLAKLGVLVFSMVGFVVIQPDLSTSLIITAILVGLLFFAGLDVKYFISVIIASGIFSAPIWNSLKDYQKERILVFINPSLDLLGAGYNVTQSIIAVGSGQLLGRGFGRGTQSHLQYLPAYWTDFIFASFAEEWGFLGVVIALGLFSGLLLTLLYVAFKSTDMFGSLLVIGVFMIFFGQYLVNIGMNMGLMPVTGIPMPLLSYGGSSLMVSVMLLGIAQSVWIYRK